MEVEELIFMYCKFSKKVTKILTKIEAVGREKGEGNKIPSKGCGF